MLAFSEIIYWSGLKIKKIKAEVKVEITKKG
jgi:hypothetical protein